MVGGVRNSIRPDQRPTENEMPMHLGRWADCIFDAVSDGCEIYSAFSHLKLLQGVQQTV